MFSDIEKALQLLEALIKELKALNENLADIKRMTADLLGWKIVDDKE